MSEKWTESELNNRLSELRAMKWEEIQHHLDEVLFITREVNRLHDVLQKKINNPNPETPALSAHSDPTKP